MLNKTDFKSAEVQSYFMDDNLPDWERLCEFFNLVFSAYNESALGAPLYMVIQSDWDLMTDDDTAERSLNEICACEELAHYHWNAQTKVVYDDAITSVVNIWNQIKEKIKTDTRFLVDISPLTDMGLDDCLGQSEEEYTDKPKVRYYRARKPLANGVRYKKKEMGMPSPQYATAGRANPTGIPYLYVCTDYETCLYEVRATYLDKVCLGTFKIRKGATLRLLNFTSPDRSEQLTSDSNPKQILKFRVLLNLIGKELSTPMRQHDNPVIEYLPTQFICEYIRKKTKVDGIIFQSSLHEDGRNVVLFSQDKVECTNVKEWEVNKIEISARKA